MATFTTGPSSFVGRMISPPKSNKEADCVMRQMRFILTYCAIFLCVALTGCDNNKKAASKSTVAAGDCLPENSFHQGLSLQQIDVMLHKTFVSGLAELRQEVKSEDVDDYSTILANMALVEQWLSTGPDFFRTQRVHPVVLYAWVLIRRDIELRSLSVGYFDASRSAKYIHFYCISSNGNETQIRVDLLPSVKTLEYYNGFWVPMTADQSLSESCEIAWSKSEVCKQDVTRDTFPIGAEEVNHCSVSIEDCNGVRGSAMPVLVLRSRNKANK